MLDVLWLLLPAGVANMAPVFAMRVSKRPHPVSEGLFGSHKTWEGLLLGIAAGWLAYLGQVAIAPHTQPLNAVDYGSVSVLLGLALSAGALAGDIGKSFCKRRMGIAPGKPWMPFDQVDYVLGALLFTLPFVHLPWQDALAAIAVYGLGSVLVNQVSYRLGLRKTRL